MWAPKVEMWEIRSCDGIVLDWKCKDTLLGNVRNSYARSLGLLGKLPSFVPSIIRVSREISSLALLSHIINGSCRQWSHLVCTVWAPVSWCHRFGVRRPPLRTKSVTGCCIKGCCFAIQFFKTLIGFLIWK